MPALPYIYLAAYHNCSNRLFKTFIFYHFQHCTLLVITSLTIRMLFFTIARSNFIFPAFQLIVGFSFCNHKSPRIRFWILDSWYNFTTAWLKCNQTSNSLSSAKLHTYQAYILSNVIIVLFLSNKIIFILQICLSYIWWKSKRDMWDDMINTKEA
jgi:hypothetical protein